MSAPSDYYGYSPSVIADDVIITWRVRKAGLGYRVEACNLAELHWHTVSWWPFERLAKWAVHREVFA